MRMIVVGVDQSEGSQRALEWAFAEAEAHGAAVRVVHAIAHPNVYFPYPMGELSWDELAEQDSDRLGRELLEEVLAAVPPPSRIDVEPVARVGAPAHVVLHAAKDADVIVVGSRGRGGFAGLMLGSVSQQIAHHATLPVVIVPPER